MRIVQISDTHGKHHQLVDLPEGDILIHCGDFTDMGTEEEALDFLNWYIDLPYSDKIFVTGNHDFCLWDAEGIEDLPTNVHFLQDKACDIRGIKFFGLAYNHSEALIPNDVDVLITHEPPIMILDKSNGTHWGNLLLYNRILQIKPKYHLFGHAHEAYGIKKQDGIIFSNGASLDDFYKICHKPKMLIYETH